MFVVCENLTIQHRHVKHYFYFYERVDLTVSRGSHRVSGLVQFENFSDGKYLFKAKMSASEYIEIFYVLKSDVDDSYDYDILLLLFPLEVEGTVLEKKLSTCFDEVAKTLTI